jgi:hypothetical protein
VAISVSIRVTRISFALNRVLSPAASPAQTMPPSDPIAIIAGSIHPEVPCGNHTGRAEAAMAPRINCPSAPMLNTLARNPIASPCAINSSGAVFSSTSEKLYQLRNGSSSSE